MKKYKGLFPIVRLVNMKIIEDNNRLKKRLKQYEYICDKCGTTQVKSKGVIKKIRPCKGKCGLLLCSICAHISCAHCYDVPWCKTCVDNDKLNDELIFCEGCGYWYCQEDIDHACEWLY